MLFKIMRNLFKENKMLTIFMILTSCMTALIGCFIYGVYENYRINLLEGVNDSTVVTIEANDWSGWMTSRTDLLIYDTSKDDLNKLFRYNNFSTLTKGDIMKVVEQIPEDMYDDIDQIQCYATLENDLMGLAPFDFYFKVTKDGLVNALSKDTAYGISDKEYNDGDRHIVLTEDFFDENVGVSAGTMAYEGESARTLKGLGDTVKIAGVDFKVSQIIPEAKRNCWYDIPLTALPDDTYMNSEFYIVFKSPVTYSQYTTIKNIVDGSISQDAHVADMDLSAASDLAYYKTIIYITAAVALLFAVNLAVLHKYVIECNKRRITVFRVCGACRGRCVSLFLGEALAVISPVFALSLFAFHKLLYQRMVQIFPNAIDCLNIQRYAAIFVAYTLVSAAVLFFMLLKNISAKLNFTQSRSSSLKLGKKAGLMNLLISLQLAVVFALVIIMMSAIKDRTVYYSQFKEPLSKNGVIVISEADNPNMRYKEDILKNLDKATDVTGGKANMIGVHKKSGDQWTYMSYFPDDMMKKLPPYLKEGSLPDPKSKIPQVLVSDNYGYKVGDKLKATDWYGVDFDIEICGILENNQRLYGTGGYNVFYNYDDDYRDFYYMYNEQGRGEEFFVTTEGQMAKVGSKGSYAFNSKLIINYPEGAYTIKEIEDLAPEVGFQIYGYTNKYYKASESFVHKELYTLSPIAISILIITLFTAVITTMITTLRNLRNYAILYLCGATWRRCSVLNFLNYLSIVGVTIVADAIFFIAGKNTILKGTVIKVGWDNIGVCAIILALFLLLSLIVPLLVVRNKQPRDVLKTEFRN